MISVLISLLATLRGLVRSRAALHVEVLALRHPLLVLQRSRPRRLSLVKADRWLWAWPVAFLDRLASGARECQTGDRHRWHRQGLRLFWTWKSRQRRGRAAVPVDVRALIRTMSEQPSLGRSADSRLDRMFQTVPAALHPTIGREEKRDSVALSANAVHSEIRRRGGTILGTTI